MAKNFRTIRDIDSTFPDQFEKGDQGKCLVSPRWAISEFSCLKAVSSDMSNEVNK